VQLRNGVAKRPVTKKKTVVKKKTGQEEDDN
jgi:hypothetical protein